MTCDDASENGWKLISKIPFGITFALLMDVLLCNDSYPGTSLRMLVTLVGMLLIIKVMKYLCMGVDSSVNGWAMRPEIGLPPSPGMPSSHTAVMTLFFTVFMCDLLVRSKNPPSRERVALTFAIGIVSVLVGISRYMTFCHTTLQIVCGALFGIVIGIIYGATFVRDPCIGRKSR